MKTLLLTAALLAATAVPARAADYLSTVDFDGAWNTLDNWENQPQLNRLTGAAYYMEGVLLTVRKDSGYGKLEAAVTVAHSDFYSHVPAGSPYRSGSETVDGTPLLVNGHPATFQEAKGHGLYRWNGSDFPGGDGVIYQPAATGASFGTFRGDNGKDNAANAPWGWDDQNDGPFYRGHLAELVNSYFANKGSFSLTYVRNSYRSRPSGNRLGLN